VLLQLLRLLMLRPLLLLRLFLRGQRSRRCKISKEEGEKKRQEIRWVGSFRSLASGFFCCEYCVRTALGFGEYCVFEP
jgi:hypothetical protein